MTPDDRFPTNADDVERHADGQLLGCLKIIAVLAVAVGVGALACAIGGGE